MAVALWSVVLLWLDCYLLYQKRGITLHNDDVRNNIFKVAVFLFSWILILIFYITYIQIVMGTEISNHPLNKRNTEYASNIQRGNIEAYDGTILAYSEKNLDGK